MLVGAKLLPEEQPLLRVQVVEVDQVEFTSMPPMLVPDLCPSAAIIGVDLMCPMHPKTAKFP
jgi:hypothetical protein